MRAPSARRDNRLRMVSKTLAERTLFRSAELVRADVAALPRSLHGIAAARTVARGVEAPVEDRSDTAFSSSPALGGALLRGRDDRLGGSPDDHARQFAVSRFFTRDAVTLARVSQCFFVSDAEVNVLTALTTLLVGAGPGDARGLRLVGSASLHGAKELGDGRVGRPCGGCGVVGVRDHREQPVGGFMRHRRGVDVACRRRRDLALDEDGEKGPAWVGSRDATKGGHRVRSGTNASQRCRAVVCGTRIQRVAPSQGCRNP